MVTNVILPCFIFAQIVNNFRISEYNLIFEAMLGCCFLFFFGLIMGFLIAKFLGLNSQRTKFLAAVFSTPHTTSIPVILIQVVGPILDKILRPSEADILGNAEKRGFLYIVLNSIFSNIWRWSGAYYLIQPDEEPNDQVQPLLEEGQGPKKQIPKFGFREFLYSIINAPLFFSALSVSVTLSPTFQSYFTTPGSLLNSSIISATMMVSKSYGFVVMFMLGLSLSDSIKLNEEDKAKKSTNFLTSCDLFWLSIMKLIVMPLLSCPFIIYIFRNWLQTDDVMVFVFLFMASAPSAINIIIICSYKDAYVETISLIMVVMYAIAIITLTLQVTFFIYILGYYNSMPSLIPIPVA